MLPLIKNYFQPTVDQLNCVVWTVWTVEAINRLVEWGANDFEPCLIQAIKNRDWLLVEKMITSGANNLNQDVISACDGDIICVRRLLEYGINVNRSDATIPTETPSFQRAKNHRLSQIDTSMIDGMSYLKIDIRSYLSDRILLLQWIDFQPMFGIITFCWDCQFEISFEWNVSQNPFVPWLHQSNSGSFCTKRDSVRSDSQRMVSIERPS